MAHSPEFEALCQAARDHVRETSVQEVHGRLTIGVPFVVVDVREDNEWQRGHISGAIHLGRGILERDVVDAIPAKDTEIVLYCGGGFRSALSAESLGKMGYTNVWSMAGGWRSWTAAGLPTTVP